MNAQPALLDVPRPSRCGTTCREPGPSHAHCATCHRTLASVSDFDRHRVDGHCVHPTSLGLVERTGLWASPERHANDTRLTALLAEGRSRARQPTPQPSESPPDTSGHPLPAGTESAPRGGPSCSLTPNPSTPDD